MNNFNKDQDQFELLRKIQKKPQSSQRELANELGFSLGKLNYCLKALKKGPLNSKIFKIVKIRLASSVRYHTQRHYKRTKLTINFMKRKMKEYDELKEELEERSKED